MRWISRQQATSSNILEDFHIQKWCNLFGFDNGNMAPVSNSLSHQFSSIRENLLMAGPWALVVTEKNVTKNYYTAKNQHDSGLSTMNEDVFPIENGEFPMSC